MSGEAVGYMILLGLDGVHRAMELRRLVVTAKGCGYGRAAVRMIKTFAFEGLAAHRLWHDVKEFNHRARRLYASEGFTVEGMLRECYLGENGFESVYVMSMLVDGLKRIRECSFGSIEPRIQKCSASFVWKEGSTSCSNNT